jgi:hypothetical protein
MSSTSHDSHDLRRNGWVRTGVFSLVPASLVALFKSLGYRPRVAVSAALAAGCSGAALYWTFVERNVQASANPRACLADSFSLPVYVGMVVATPVVSFCAMMAPLVVAHRVGWVAREAFNIAVRHRRRAGLPRTPQVDKDWIRSAPIAWRPVSDAAVRRQLLARLFSQSTIRDIALSAWELVFLHRWVVPMSLFLCVPCSVMFFPLQHYFYVRMEQ